VLGDELPLAVRNGMALADKAYFHALWTDGRWVFGERTRDRAW
jgi:xylose isomerase